MRAVITWMDKLPFLPTIIIVGMLAIAPYSPEPHVWEKLKMLFSGTLVRPVDIFDLVLHGSAAILLVLRVARWGYIKIGNKKIA